MALLEMRLLEDGDIPATKHDIPISKHDIYTTKDELLTVSGGSDSSRAHRRMNERS
jgi:hypothetical protein